MNTKVSLLGVCTAFAVLGAIWPVVRAQDKKVRVWVCPGNSDAAAVAEGVEARLNSTVRFETVKDTYKTDIVLFVNCMSVEETPHNKLGNQLVCSSAAQVVVADIVSVPYDEADDLVVGTPDYAASMIFERAVSHSSDGGLQKARDNFLKKISLYCRMVACTAQQE